MYPVLSIQLIQGAQNDRLSYRLSAAVFNKPTKTNCKPKFLINNIDGKHNASLRYYVTLNRIRTNGAGCCAI